MTSTDLTGAATIVDVGSPFLAPETCETAVHRALRAALANVHRNGMCEFIEGPGSDDVSRVSVCGFAISDDPPSAAVHAAAQYLLHEVARGSGWEADCTALEYDEILETIMIYTDSCSFYDAQACAFIEGAYRRVAQPDDLVAPPGEWNAPAIIVLD